MAKELIFETRITETGLELSEHDLKIIKKLGTDKLSIRIIDTVAEICKRENISIKKVLKFSKVQKLAPEISLGFFKSKGKISELNY